MDTRSSEDLVQIAIGRGSRVYDAYDLLQSLMGGCLTLGPGCRGWTEPWVGKINMEECDDEEIQKVRDTLRSSSHRWAAFYSGPDQGITLMFREDRDAMLFKLAWVPHE